MHDGTLLLGPVLFQDFEIPERITWGGAQRLAVHQLPGGARVIDALGRDDAEITWSGIFTGTDAAARARLLDTLRADGALWPLTWDTFFYTVVIRSFVADFSRSIWIPYRIACTVLVDDAAAAIDALASLAADAASDLAAAVGFALPIDLSGASAAIAVAGATVVGTAPYAAATASLGAAATTLDASLASAGASLVTAADPGTAADQAGTVAALAGARGYVQRAATNLANASS